MEIKMLGLKAIREAAHDEHTYLNGWALYRADAVMGLTYNRLNNEFNARIKGTPIYKPIVTYDSNQGTLTYECQCPEYYSQDLACEHVIAIMLSIQEHGDKLMAFDTNPMRPKVMPLTPETKQMLQFYQALATINAQHDHSSQEPVALIPALHLSHHRSPMVLERHLEFEIGRERTYVVKHLLNFTKDLIDKAPIQFGKSLTLNPDTDTYTSGSYPLIELLKSTYREPYRARHFDGKGLMLSDSMFYQFLDNVAKDPEATLKVVIDKKSYPSVPLVSGRPKLSLGISALETAIQTQILSKDLFALDEACKYFYQDHTIFRVDQEFSRYMRPLMLCFDENNDATFILPKEALDRYLTTALPQIEKVATISLDPAFESEFYRSPLKIHAYFDKRGKGIQVLIKFIYDQLIINPAQEAYSGFPPQKGPRLLRDLPKEDFFLNLLKAYDFKKNQGIFALDSESDSFTFLKQGLDTIVAHAEVYYTEDFKSIRQMQRRTLNCGVRVDLDTRLMALDFDYGDMDPQELSQILKAYRQKKHYYRLKNGQFIDLAHDAIHQVADLLEHLHLSDKDFINGHIHMPMHRALLVDHLTKDYKDFHLIRDKNFKALVRAISTPEKLTFKIPSDQAAILRDYQKTGYQWLRTLDQYGFGGILADDMGLGKTLQVITLIQGYPRTMPSLVVAPTSLVFNWFEEVAKFAPKLKVMIISGNPGTRLEQFSEIGSVDLVVTTYGLVKRDIEHYQQYNFRFCILDEAQHIKNPITKNAKSVKQIKAMNYFALTGTPIENTLTELWSIFDFVMPGYLSSHHHFTKHFEIPIVRNNNRERMKALGNAIHPFILRRMKRDVLKELPDKIESKMSSEMTPEQHKLYRAYSFQAQKEFDQAIAKDGFEKNQIQILAILTRLRQICCHPGTFLEDYRGGSGKLEQLIELVKDAIEAQHRLLVFSQFTSALELIKEQLNAEGIAYSYLDGQTPTKQRMALVNDFNAGDKDVFLISLKAGGTGINLTGADIVIHFDPWWNPAVEDQATDRAYRLGQTRAVQVFKLIAKNTIEEKIYALQQKKKELINSVIKPGESFVTQLTESEIRDLISFSSP